jgi:hypothetical protein
MAFGQVGDETRILFAEADQGLVLFSTRRTEKRPLRR